MLRVAALLMALTATAVLAAPAPPAAKPPAATPQAPAAFPAAPAAQAEKPAAPAAPVYRYPIGSIGKVAVINRALKAVTVSDVTVSMAGIAADRKSKTWRIRVTFRNNEKVTHSPTVALHLFQGDKTLGGLMLLDGAFPIKAQASVVVEKLVQLPAANTPNAFGISEQMLRVASPGATRAPIVPPQPPQQGARPNDRTQGQQPGGAGRGERPGGRGPGGRFPRDGQRR